MNLSSKGDGFFGVAHIRFGDDFNERCAGAIKIDTRKVTVEIAFVKGLAGIFF